MTEGKKEFETTIISMNLIADHIQKVAANLDVASVTSLITHVSKKRKFHLIF